MKNLKKVKVKNKKKKKDMNDKARFDVIEYLQKFINDYQKKKEMKGKKINELQ